MINVRRDFKHLRKFFNNTEYNGDCLEFTGSKTLSGYGVIGFHGKSEYVHRLSYMWFNGLKSIPKGMEVCHSCDNPSCVNPDHLWLGTHGENMNDSKIKGRSSNQNKNKEYCKNGHKFTDENTYIPPAGGRSCRICKRKLLRDYRKSKKEKQNEVHKS